jgi:hypothetical protein
VPLHDDTQITSLPLLILNLLLILRIILKTCRAAVFIVQPVTALS